LKLWTTKLGNITLQEKSFIAQGGQGRVYAYGEQAIKLYNPDATPLPADKFLELLAIQDDGVIRPQELTYDKQRGRIIGYTMRLLRDTYSLCQLFPKSFRQQKGLDPNTMMQLVVQLKSRIDAVHATGSLLVDINDMNFLIDQQLSTVYAIDCDNFQTASFPACAASPSTRDPQTLQGIPFSQASDWYAFAIVAFQMMIGVHPYRGKHPAGGKLMERMRHHRSAFAQGAKLPPVALGLDVIPTRFRSWLHNVLEEGERSAPPSKLWGAHATSPSATTGSTPQSSTPQSSTLRISELLKTPHAIVDAVANPHGEVFLSCKDGVYDGQGRSLFRGSTLNTTLALSPRGRPVLLGPECFWDLRRGQAMKNPSQARRFVRCGDAIWALSDSQLVEVQLVDVGSTVVASTKPLAFVAPHGTRLFDGLAVQSLLGSCHLLLPTAKGCIQLHVPELDGKKVIAAMHRRGVAIVYLQEKSMLRALQIQLCRNGCPAAAMRYVIKNLGPTESPSFELIVLEKGLAVVREHHRLRLFDRLPHRPAEQLLVEEKLGTGGWFFPNGNRIFWCLNNQLFWLQSQCRAA
jgi:hypothetical protein